MFRLLVPMLETLATRLRAVSAAAVLAALLVPSIARGDTNPLAASAPWFVDYQRNPAAVQACNWQRAHPDWAARMTQLATQPQFYWMGSWMAEKPGGMHLAVRTLLDRIREDPFNTPTTCGRDPQPGYFWHNRPFAIPQLEQARQAYIAQVQASGRPATALLVFKGFEELSSPCGRYTGYGDHPTRYRAWVRSLASGIGRAHTAIVLEPDALGLSHCETAAARKRRLALMSYASKTLSALPNTTVYIDIGAADWLSVRQAAALLRGAGVRYARGFSLNVTHKDWTANELRYGDRIVTALGGGKHFIVNTVMNGAGPQRPPDIVHMGNEVWCNPSRARLGTPPTTNTGDPNADGLMWIGNPAVSNGDCRFNGGLNGPKGDVFWPAYALLLTGMSAKAAGIN